MKTYQDYVKELLFGLIYNSHQKKWVNVGYATVFLPRESKHKIIEQLREKYLPEEELDPRTRNYRRHRRDDLPDLMETVIEDYGHKEDIYAHVVEELKSSELKIKHIPDFNLSLERLKEFFTLDDVAVTLLAYFFILEQEESFFDELICKREKKQGLLGRHEFISPKKSEVMSALSEKGTLFMCGLLSKYGANDLEISARINDYLLGSACEDFSENFITTTDKEILPLSYFHVEEERVEILKKILSSKTPVNILLDGPPGVGKTSFAYSLINELGLDPVYLKHDLEEEEDRKIGLYSARRLASRTEKVLIIDEADDIISHKMNFFFGKSKDNNKAWINSFLDANEARIIWITNSTNRIEDSTCRRFNYILKFKSLNFIQRQNIWLNVIEKYAKNWIAVLPEFERIVRKYSIDAGSIDDAVMRATDRSYLIHYLDQKMAFLQGSSDAKDELRENYSLDALNLSSSPDEIIEALKKYEQRKSKIPNFNLLLQGPSGCGKTEFVKYLGKELDKEILLKTASDLTSKYVGETEQNIKKAFEQAEADEAILFLDEADSFFQPREGAQRQWEITQVNELLVRMERFRGILICSTNFIENFDKASLRRFQFKVRFNYMNEKGKRALFTKYFPQLSEDLETFISQVGSINNLAAGDFKNIALRLQYRETYSCDDIIKEIRGEVSYKKSKGQLGLQV